MVKKMIWYLTTTNAKCESGQSPGSSGRLLAEDLATLNRAVPFKFTATGAKAATNAKGFGISKAAGSNSPVPPGLP